MRRLQLLGLPKSAKSRIMSAFWSQGMYGAEVNGLSQALLRKLRGVGRAALKLLILIIGRGARKRHSAEIELSLAGQAAKDPQVVADVTLIRTWDRWIQRGGSWPPLIRSGPLSALAEFAQRVSWHPGEAGWRTTRGFVPWCQASATGAQDSQAWLLNQVATRRPDFAGLEAGLDCLARSTRIAALHGVSEDDHRGNDRADKAANEVLAAFNGRQAKWIRYRAFASQFRTFLGLIGPTLSERIAKEKLLVRPQLPCEESQVDDLEWPFDFEGHTLEREAVGRPNCAVLSVARGLLISLAGRGGLTFVSSAVLLKDGAVGHVVLFSKTRHSWKRLAPPRLGRVVPGLEPDQK
eukprot:4528193-Amphidinium_carterae.1